MEKWTQEEMNLAYNEIARKAADDPQFRADLIADPNKAISAALGREIPADYKIRIIEFDPAYDATFFLPDYSSEEYSADELDAIAGGSCEGNVCGANGCAGQITK